MTISKWKIIWSVVIVVLSVACIFLLLEISKLRDELAKTENELSKVRMSEKEREKKIEHLFESSKPPRVHYLTLTSKEIESLKRRGLEDPYRDIVDDLVKHHELIPYEGVLGGQMLFSRKYTVVLGPRRVLAYYDDGHIDGHMLLEYEVSDQGMISWRLLEPGLGE